LSKRAAIFANGELVGPRFVRELIAPDDLIIAANGGLRHAFALGLVPAIVIGDLDSLPNELLQLAQHRGAELVRYPIAKDKTDLELALELARERGASHIRIFAAVGGRPDQALANILLLANPELSNIDVRIVDERYEIVLVRQQIEMTGRSGDVVSLLALSDTVTGITTHGLHYALKEGTIRRGSSLGISNRMLGERASVSVVDGLLLVVRLSEVE
jgi:thiamine pyrophosphokinase